mgnify:CR=1 FL=1|tara:strand:+ start:715 stop:993 length:279 start_codon:yes stop_codon:yes gene_type:complete
MSNTEVKIDILELDNKLARIADGIEVMKEKQDFMVGDIKKIKEAVYNPENGIYVRLRELESWKKSQSKIFWIVVTSIVGLATAIIFNQVLGQ